METQEKINTVRKSSFQKCLFYDQKVNFNRDSRKLHKGTWDFLKANFKYILNTLTISYS